MMKVVVVVVETGLALTAGPQAILMITQAFLVRLEQSAELIQTRT
tara:strand:- start:17092 stop:17226 length:135 start_codon:yes stop_codon:yes gene_type:complete